MITADLHIHTENSPDGEFNTERILNEALLADLTIISITDHNTVGGIASTIRDSAGAGITIIPGIEIDCVYKGVDLHVLGYNIQWKSPDFKMLEEQVSGKILGAFDQMISNLKPMGIDVDPGVILAEAGSRLPSAEMIAEHLLTSPEYDKLGILDPYRPGGKRSDMPYLNFYLDFFAQGKPAYVKIAFMDFSEAISLIERNGGIPVVAHPGHNLKGREEVVLELLEQGAKGLEVFNNYHSEKQIDLLAGMAIKNNVLMTCGSDFHGKNKPTIHIGEFRSQERFEGYVLQSIEELLC